MIKGRADTYREGPLWLFLGLFLLALEAVPELLRVVSAFFPQFTKSNEGWVLGIYLFIVLFFGFTIFFKKINHKRSEKSNKFKDVEESKNSDPDSDLLSDPDSVLASDPDSDLLSDPDSDIFFDPDSDLLSDLIMEDINKTNKQEMRRRWLLGIFKRIPIDIITLRIIPLTISWIIKKIGTRGYLGVTDVFGLPNSWERERRKEFKKKYFNQIIRFDIIKEEAVGKKYSGYQIKFSKDYKSLGVEEVPDIYESNNYSEDKNVTELTNEDGRYICEIVSWTTPFGLYWNLIRVAKVFLITSVCKLKALFTRFL